MVSRGPWLPGPVEPAGSTMRVFCFPHAGGAASAFRSWHRAAPPGIEVRPVQLPGREGRHQEALPTGITDLAPRLADALLPFLELPFALVGNSMGALIAFELARYLQEHHQLSPVRLVVAAAHAPGQARTHAPLCGLADREFVAALQARHGGIPQAILDEPAFLGMFLPVLRADMAMVEAYEPAPAPLVTCPVTALAGATDPAIGRQQLSAWRAWTAGQFDSLEIPGDHFAVLGHAGLVLNRASRDLLRR